MKNIFLIGGTMGVGKTTTCHILKNNLKNSVFLDGDSCIRHEDVISISIERIPLYEKLHTFKIDVSKITAEETADLIINNF